eukprot:3436924-Prorocentrum_lima.AAC.1
MEEEYWSNEDEHWEEWTEDDLPPEPFRPIDQVLQHPMSSSSYYHVNVRDIVAHWNASARLHRLGHWTHPPHEFHSII